MPLKVVETASVPDPVTGDPDTEKPVGIDRPTDVTVPAPDGVVHAKEVPFHSR
jgi:hypothetical protein